MSTYEQYYAINTNGQLMITIHHDLVMARYKLNINEQRLFHLLMAQRKADETRFLPYEMTSKDWVSIRGGSMASANVIMKRLAGSLKDKVISFEKNKYPMLKEVLIVEFIEYYDGKLRVKLNDQLASFIQ